MRIRREVGGRRRCARAVRGIVDRAHRLDVDLAREVLEHRAAVLGDGQFGELDLLIRCRRDPVPQLAVDDDRLRASEHRRARNGVRDRAVRERHERRPAPKGRERVRGRHRVQVAADMERSGLHRDRVRPRPEAPVADAPRSAGVDREQLVAADDDRAHLEDPAVEPLHRHVDELDLLVFVEQVGQPLGVEADVAVEPAVLRVGDELDLGGVPVGLGRGLVPLDGPIPAKDEAKAVSDRHRWCRGRYECRAPMSLVRKSPLGPVATEPQPSRSRIASDGASAGVGSPPDVLETAEADSGAMPDARPVSWQESGRGATGAPSRPSRE